MEEEYEVGVEPGEGGLGDELVEGVPTDVQVRVNTSPNDRVIKEWRERYLRDVKHPFE